MTMTSFLNGSVWLRADFHLHTKADKEFQYDDEDNQFVHSYIQSLKTAGIQVAVITNHNKFDLNEYKALCKAGRREEILVLPGVELSVKDGRSGVHTLIVFENEWIEDSTNHIQSFLTATFAGQSNFENENARSNHDLLETIHRLDEFNRDYFFVFAHVEAENGLWGGLSGGRIQELGGNESFRQRCLGFQKVRTQEKRDTVKNWLRDWYPAEVEGSDGKALDEVGQSKQTYLKLGDFSFGAVKYALMDYQNRVSAKPKKHESSHIISATFEGGVLDGKTIHFSPELNTLIGIRGSGKSSILEAVRYVLDIPFGEKSLDTDYKKSLIGHVLGSGGKITVQAIDCRGQRYEIRRIYKERPDVYVEGILQPGVSIRETILRKPLYFGQKDLSSTGEGFEKDLVEKLVWEKLADIRTQIDAQRQKVSEAVTQLKKLSTTAEKKKEFEAKKQDAEFKLKFYKEHGVEEKLQKQVDFDADSRKCAQVIFFVKSYLSDLEAFINQYEDGLKNQRVYKSRQNQEFFDGFFTIYDELIRFLENISAALSEGRKSLVALQDKAKQFEKLKDGLKEEFANIERTLTEELKVSGIKAIRADEFREFRRTVDQAKQMLKVLEHQETQRITLNRELLQELARLNDFYLAEYNAIQDELNTVNQSHSSLEIKAEFKADKDSFVDYMKDIFRGSRIREATFSSLAREFSDFGAMYKEFDKVRTLVGGSAKIFEEYFLDNLSALLTWQVPNRFIIEYRGKELKHHSLGQRASALILFVLSQGENDVIIIDQPEDDLDNQTIYEDVIKLVRSLKPTTQFIFATHNANFPVLGDAEQILSCAYSDDVISMTSGNIDCPALQKEIVDIMEGGEEAFRQRKKIYEIWKPKNS
ncbi:MAG: histidinol-phosphatase [Nitrospira sp. SB0673_bin_12]|nr:histidinol-phosphatase [Nitrospira sp. SB0673_bin_12]